MSRLFVCTAVIAVLAGCGRSGRSESGVVNAAAFPAGVPEWVPLYPGGRAVGNVDTQKAGIETYIKFQLQAPVDCLKALGWYDEQMKKMGFNVVSNYGPATGCSYSNVNGDGPGNTRGLKIAAGPAAGSSAQISITAVVRDLPGTSSSAVVPSWVPSYPGSKPANVVSSSEGRRVEFNYATNDDAQLVIGWYDRTLKEHRFTVVSSTIFDASTAKFVAQDPTGRQILNIRIEPAGNGKVVAIEARDDDR